MMGEAYKQGSRSSLGEPLINQTTVAAVVFFVQFSICQFTLLLYHNPIGIKGKNPFKAWIDAFNKNLQKSNKSLLLLFNLQINLILYNS